MFDYVRAQRDDVNFFAFGIGSAVNRLLIEGVAKAGLGEPFVVTEASEAAEAAVRLRRYIDTPVLTGIDVKFSGFDARCRAGVDPRPLCQPPDCRFRKVARQAGRIDRDLGTDRSRTVPGVDSRLLCNAHVTHAALRHLWARTRIAVLSDFGPTNPSEERVAEITSLGLA